MPVQRRDTEDPSVKSKYFKQHRQNTDDALTAPNIVALNTQEPEEKTPQDVDACSESSSSHIAIFYPSTQVERKKYTTKGGKKVTSHQWAVYDSIMKIPSGKVTTYKHVAEAAGGSARSVGGALRNNPFAPYVPCHRVIASNLFVGGFFGEWGKEHKTGTRCNQKLELLSQEGVYFDARGHLKNSDTALWPPSD